MMMFNCANFKRRGHLNAVVSLDFESENWFDFIARWSLWYYKFLQYRVERCV